MEVRFLIAEKGQMLCSTRWGLGEGRGRSEKNVK